MVRIDRYILSQMLVIFGFFALVLVAIFWINRAVVLFERLISDGQTALVFLEFTVLGLPQLITTVMPIAAFGAAAYVTNRLSNESELTVLQATGSSPWRLARPVLIFGIVCWAMSSVLYHALLPMSQAQLDLREAEVSQNATARLLTEGAFLNPAPGITFYTQTIREDGALQEVFLADRRRPAEEVIYTAAEAYLLGSEDTTTLIMVNGLAQRLDADTRQMSTTFYRDVAFDISALTRGAVDTDSRVQALTTPELFGALETLMARTGQSQGVLAEELHGRFVEPLFCIVAALIGFTTLMIGGYSRFGIWREVFLAFALLLLIDGIRSALRDPVRQSAELWPMLYAPLLAGTVLAVGMLWQAARPRRRRTRRTPDSSSGGGHPSGEAPA